MPETGFDGDFDEYAQQDLRLKAEKAKQQLSTREKVPVMMDAAGLRARVEITRQTFDEITEALLNESIEKTCPLPELMDRKKRDIMERKGDKEDENKRQKQQKESSAAAL